MALAMPGIDAEAPASVRKVWFENKSTSRDENALSEHGIIATKMENKEESFSTTFRMLYPSWRAIFRLGSNATQTSDSKNTVKPYLPLASLMISWRCNSFTLPKVASKKN